jgi:hypothetical protein
MKKILLNYDPNFLKVIKLVSEVEARRREAWAGALDLLRSGPMMV